MTKYTDYPFTAKGFNFVSRIASHSPFNESIERMGKDEFAKLNQLAISDLLSANTYTLAEIKERLDILNDGATHAWVLLESEAL